jgi:DNA-binding MarR family transcriptional regulator
MAKSADPPLFLQAWVAFLTAHALVVPRVSQELEAACGISLAWFDVLHQLALAPEGRRRMHELADAVLLSKSGLTRLVDRMEEAGLVTRAAVPGDRRSLHVQLTPAGRRLVGKARRVVRQIVAEHFGEHLSEAELATLRDSLARVARASAASP